MKKFSEISESIIGDTLLRGSGDVVRKVDDINNLSAKDFYDYICDNYRVIDNVARTSFRWGIITLPIEYRIYLTAVYNDDILSKVYTSSSITGRCSKKKLEKLCVLTKDMDDDRNLILTPRDGKPNNQLILDLLDFFRENVEEPQMVRKEEFE